VKLKNRKSNQKLNDYFEVLSVVLGRLLFTKFGSGFRAARNAPNVERLSFLLYLPHG